MTALRFLERVLLVVGILALAFYGAAHLYRVTSSEKALKNFQQAIRQVPEGNGAGIPVPSSAEVDFSLWSPKRITSYLESLTTHSASPVAVLKIPKIHIEVPVFDGTDELTLNRGVGRILGTSKPGQPGNIGIAGHRDGFFRGLKDIATGDTVELVTLNGPIEYFVDSIKIVKPEDVSVLADRGIPTLTLATCYPFYFVGDAPERWIVQCTLKGARKEENMNDSRSQDQKPLYKETK